MFLSNFISVRGFFRTVVSFGTRFLSIVMKLFRAPCFVQARFLVAHDEANKAAKWRFRINHRYPQMLDHRPVSVPPDDNIRTAKLVR